MPKALEIGAGLTMGKTKQRQTKSQTITFDMGVPVAIDGYRIDSDSSMHLLANGAEVKPVSVFVGEHRHTPRKEKILTRVPAPTASMRHIHPIAALGTFDHVFAVDTGTKIIGGEQTNFSVFAECVLRRRAGLADGMRGHIVGAVEFRGQTDKPENLGWRFLLIALEAMGILSQSRRIAIVTDSDLGNHEAYNRLAKPYCGEVVLPHGIQLVYASGDSGNENLSKLIRLCDKAATSFLLQAQQASFPKPIGQEGREHFIRRWRPTPSGWEYSSLTDELTTKMLEAAGWL